MDADRYSYKKWQGDAPNFITPTLEGFDCIGPFVVELSSGSRIGDTGTMYGISVLKRTADGYESVGTGDRFEPVVGTAYAKGTAMRRYGEALEAVRRYVKGEGQ